MSWLPHIERKPLINTAGLPSIHPSIPAPFLSKHLLFCLCYTPKSSWNQIERHRFRIITKYLVLSHCEQSRARISLCLQRLQMDLCLLRSHTVCWHWLAQNMNKKHMSPRVLRLSQWIYGESTNLPPPLPPTFMNLKGWGGVIMIHLSGILIMSIREMKEPNKASQSTNRALNGIEHSPVIHSHAFE